MDTRPYVKVRSNTVEKDQTLWRETKHRGERPNNTVGNIFLSVPYQYQPWNFKHGFALQTLLSIIILCAKVSIVGLQVGLSKATHFKDGRRTVFLSGLLDATIPDEVFQEIKNTETVMEVWAAYIEHYDWEKAWRPNGDSKIPLRNLRRTCSSYRLSVRSAPMIRQSAPPVRTCTLAPATTKTATTL